MTMAGKSCITPETWDQMIGDVSKQQKDCTIKTIKNAHGYTFNGSCTMAHGIVMQLNGASTIQDSEHIIAESHSIMTVNGQKREINTRSTSRFIGSDCGDIKPGEPKVEDK